MDKKVVMFKKVKYEKMYRDYYKKPENRIFTLRCWFQAETVVSEKTS